MLYDAQDYARLRQAALAVSLVAWLLLIRPEMTPAAQAAGVTSLPLTVCSAPAAGAATAGLGWLPAPAVLAALGSNWLLMLAAMMTPLLVDPLYHIRYSSFARRRLRASLLFALSYAAVWAVVGAGLLAVAQAARSWTAATYLPAAVAALLAVVWQVSPAKQRLLNRCHRHRPLAAFGRAADRDALLMGLEHGSWCAGSCWALMLLPLLLPHGHLPAMAAAGLLMFCERLDPPQAPAWRWRGFGTASRYLWLRLRGPQVAAA